MDASESPLVWQQQVKVARSRLESMGDKDVYLLVETQLLLDEYLAGRQKQHLLYKIARADSAQALSDDFLVGKRATAITFANATRASRPLTHSTCPCQMFEQTLTSKKENKRMQPFLAHAAT